MRTITIVLLSTLALAACKDKASDLGSATTTGATQAGPTADEVRSALLAKRPNGQDAINSVIITNDSGTILLRGKVDDESTHAEIVSTVKAMPNVKGVRDELTVMPKTGLGGAMDRGGQMAQGAAGAAAGAAGAAMGTGGSDQSGAGAGTDQKMGMGDQKTGAAGSGDQKMGQKSKTTEAIRAQMAKDRPTAALTITNLSILETPDMIVVSGTVNDEPTHQSLLKSAQKGASGKKVDDQMHVTGK